VAVHCELRDGECARASQPTPVCFPEDVSGDASSGPE